MKFLQCCDLCVFVCLFVCLFVFLALRCSLFYIFIVDSFGEIYIVRRGDTVLIKFHH
jgi:hypothetical protein